MQIGIGSYTYGWEAGTYGRELTDGMSYVTARELINRARAFDVPVVQICVMPALHEMTDEELSSISSYATDRGIILETGTIGNDPAHLMRYLEVSKKINAKLLRVLISNPSPGLEDDEARFREVISHFENAGVTIAVENHETYGSRDLAALMENVGSDQLGVCLDTVNCLGRGEGVREVTEILLPYTVNLHLKDYTVVRGSTDMGFTITGAPQGSGRLDTDWLLSKAYERDSGMSVILEQWTPYSGDVNETIEIQKQWAQAGIQSIKDAVMRLGDSA